MELDCLSRTELIVCEDSEMPESEEEQSAMVSRRSLELEKGTGEEESRGMASSVLSNMSTNCS